MAVLVIFELVF